MDHSALLYGRDRDASARLLGVAGLLFAATFVAHSPETTFGVSIPYALGFGTLFFFMLIIPMLAAAYNDGALVSVSLALAPALGFFVPQGYYGLSDPHPSVFGALAIAVAAAATMGLCGFLFGHVGRQMVDSFR